MAPQDARVCDLSFESTVAVLNLNAGEPWNADVRNLGQRRFDAEGGIAALITRDGAVVSIDISDPLAPVQLDAQPLVISDVELHYVAVAAGRVFAVGEAGNNDITVAEFDPKAANPQLSVVGSGDGDESYVVAAQGCTFAGEEDTDPYAWKLDLRQGQRRLE